MIVKFRLRNGDLFNFEYYGFSELIDSLEIDEDSGNGDDRNIINVIEFFSLDEFSEAYEIYLKYIEFKYKLEDIRHYRKLWTIEELDIDYIRDIFNSDGLFRNNILNWLCIIPTKEEKVIVRECNIKNLVVKLISIDSEILYYFANGTDREKFTNCIKKGHINSAKWMYKNKGIDVKYWYNEPFRWAIYEENLEMIKWLYSLGEVDMHCFENWAFYYIVVEKGNLEIAKYLFSLDSGFNSGEELTIKTNKYTKEFLERILNLCIKVNRFPDGISWLKTLIN